MNTTNTRYFHAENSNRYISRLRLAFTQYQMLGGSWHGVYATSRKEELEALEVEVKNQRSAVTEISAEEYGRCLQKKTRSDRGSAIMNVPQPPSSTTGILGDVPPVGAPVETELTGPPLAPGSIPARSEAEALTVGDVSTGATETQAPVPPVGGGTPGAGADLS
jgi:hypothetical protein